MIGLSFSFVALGQALFWVMIALSNALWLGQEGVAGILGIAF